jgi:hypothetical protein
MRIVSIIARVLLGSILLVFGLNGFLHFLPMPAPTGVAGQFLGALYVSHYLSLIFLAQLIPAVLLLANRFVPLALTIVGPVIVNILAFHVLMQPSGLPLALLVTALWFTVYSYHSAAFASLFEQRSPEPGRIRRHEWQGATR